MKRTFIFFGLFMFLSDVLWAFDKDGYIKPEAAETLYVWQSPCWPNFEYDLSEVQTTLEAYDRETAALSQRFYNLSPSLQREVMRKIIALDAIKILKLDNDTNHTELFSLLENDIKDNDLKKSRDLGFARLIFLSSQTFKDPLSQEQLFKYHDTVIMDPLQRDRIKVSQWRTKQIYVKDWEQDKLWRRIRYRPPPPTKINEEISKFITWFNKTDPLHGTVKIPSLVRAAIVYFYFESIHPFRDGNGRVGRALVNKTIWQGLRWPMFTFSNLLKSEIIARALDQQSMKLSGDLTPWVILFVTFAYQEFLNSKAHIITALEEAEAQSQQAKTCSPCAFP